MVLQLLALPVALAAPPAGLDDLVALALERDPEVRALQLEMEAATAFGAAARRPMDPEFMVGVEALGAMADAPDETMAMVGVTQMFRGFGEGKALARRADLDGARAAVDRERIEADLRTRLWQTSARIGALEETQALLETQRTSAQAVGEIALARYGAAVSVAAGSGSMGPGMPMDAAPMDMGSTPAATLRPAGGGGMGMPGMGGGGGGGGGGGRPTVSMPSATGMPAGSAGSRPMTGGGSGLPGLLALDAEVARVEADQAALAAELAGELTVLATFVGPEAAEAVRATPAAFLGGAPRGVPERRLSDVDRQIAAANLGIARATRRPDWMLSVAERVMPDGMPAGTDLALGVRLPLWGGGAQTISAAQAELEAATTRAERVDRDLAVAVAGSRAALEAAQVRARVLGTTVVPKAVAAWEASLSAFSAGALGAEDVLRAWQTRNAAEREAVLARRDVHLRAADLTRVEGS